LHQVVRGTTHLAGIMPMGGGRCSFYWGLRGDAREALQQRGFPAWRDEVLRFCPPAEEVFEEIDGFEQVPFTSYRHVWMRSWHDGPVLFLGDAAHAMSPHLGQGINFALLDAQCFADALAAAPDYLTAFRAYCSARRRHLRFYATVTFLLTPFFQSDGLIKGWGRDVVLPVLPRVPLVRRQMLLAMAGLKKGFLGGRMVI
jgi:2-polyprenyl-6-methoxyphenol hydroxylase-like FAD-dependent oxidoreductase